MNERILVVDDEPDVVSMIKHSLEMNDYQILTARNSREASAKLKELPDLILLDINMPGMNGIDFCRTMRETIQCPILFITAKANEEDRIEGLMVGGDDYIVKPFSLKELDARIIAHLRREKRKNQNQDVLAVNDFKIVLDQRLFYAGDEVIELTKTEFGILQYLVVNKGQVLTKDQIYDHLWSWEKEGDVTIITEHIRRIRSKIKLFSDRELIETIWGVGYRVNI